MHSDYVPHEKVAIRPMDCLREAKAVIGDQYWLFVGITTLGLLIANAVPFGLLLGPMMCGIYLCFQDRLNGKRTAFETLFKGFDYFLETLVATLILVGVSMVVIVPVYIVMMISMFGMMHGGEEWSGGLVLVFAGCGMLMLVASVAMYVLFLFVYPLILFGRLKAIPAIKPASAGR